MSLRRYLVAGAAAFGMTLPTLAEAQTLASTTTELILRAGPGTHHAMIDVMPRGAQVHMHQCTGGWCQVNHGRTTGWASQRYLATDLAMQPRVQGRTSGPTVSFSFGADRYATPLPPGYEPWRARAPGWYGDHYWDGRRWYYDDEWHDRPRSGFSITLGR